MSAEHDQQMLADGILDRVFDALPAPVLVAVPDTLAVLGANPAFCELVGLARAEVIGREPPYPWSADLLDDELAGAAGAGDGRGVDQLFRRSDGSLVPVGLHSMILAGAEGDPARVVTFCTDQSERIRFEQQLVQSGKMAALGELAAGVAHEINNPLFAILGIVEFLLKDTEPGTRAHERLELVQQTGLEIKEIVRALLDFARERSDELRVVDLRDVVRDTADLLRRASSARGIELVERLPAVPVPVKGSPNQLKQVLLNLLSNARQAMPDGGTATIEVGRRDGWATLGVTDTGPGVSDELAGRIFEPFFTTKRDSGGTGLGLSVSLGIARMLGGELTAEAAPGGGASFTLRLQLAPSAEEDRDARTGEAGAGR